MTRYPRTESSKRIKNDSSIIVGHSIRRWCQLALLAYVFVHGVTIDFFVAHASPDNRSDGKNSGQNLPPRHNRHWPQDGSPQSSAVSGIDNNKNTGENDVNNGLIQIIESEVWDAAENSWKAGTEGGNRWTNEKGHLSPSPAEVDPPDGWDFLGDWKIVVSSNSSGDSKGWEYHFQYLQPPRRRRIWLRSLSPSKAIPQQPTPLVPVKAPPVTTRKKFQRTNQLSRTIQAIRDDWNYKGLGFNMWKSFIFPSSFGCGLRIPLSINFDTFDRNPSWPILSSSIAAFYPPMVVGFLTTSFHVEWVKWVVVCTLGLVPRSIFWVFYRIILPIIWTALSIALVPLRGASALPPCPTKIPSGAWWTGRNIAKPRYNPEMSERIGCSISYRWSKKRGYEWRVSYWHSYLPTLLVYQQFFSQIQEKFKGGNNSLASLSASKAQKNWWRRHTASLGVSTSGPIPDTPPISCSANFSLSGLYWGARQTMGNRITTSSTSKTDTISSRASGSQDDEETNKDEKYQDRISPSTRIRTATMKG